MSMKLKTIQGLEFTIDNEDYKLVSQYRWSYTLGGKGKKVNRIHKYLRTSSVHFFQGKKKPILLTHLLMGGIEPGLQVDHINHDTMDNRKENLRICTKSQNQMNKRFYDTNTSGFRGVRMRRGRWYAAISVGGKNIRGGTFDTAREAALRYNEMSKKYHGEFGNLNIL